MKLLDWDHLRVVLAISRAGSLSGAAKLLGLDQTTAGRRLTSLETSMGTSLYRRARSGLVPTEAGLAVVAEAREIESRIAALSDSLTPDGSSIEGIVRILGNGWMLSRLAELAVPQLLGAHPGLEIRFVGRLPPTPVYGEPTLALWFDAGASSPDTARPLARIPYAAYRARDLPPDSLDWVIFRDDDAEGPSFSREAIRRIGREARVRMTATDATILVNAVRGCIGHGILPVCLGDADPALVRSEAQVGPIERVLYLHTSPDFAGRARLLTVQSWLPVALAEATGALPLK